MKEKTYGFVSVLWCTLLCLPKSVPRKINLEFPAAKTLRFDQYRTYFSRVYKSRFCKTLTLITLVL